MTTTAGHSFYIGPIGFFYNQGNDTGSWEPLVYLRVHTLKINTYTHRVDTWYSGLQRLFRIFDNNTGIHNMLKYTHNTFNRKI
jgi:hypothetical protein